MNKRPPRANPYKAHEPCDVIGDDWVAPPPNVADDVERLGVGLSEILRKLAGELRAGNAEVARLSREVATLKELVKGSVKAPASAPQAPPSATEYKTPFDDDNGPQVAKGRGPRKMVAKFNGKCVCCHGRIMAGDPIAYDRETGASHVSCANASAA